MLNSIPIPERHFSAVVTACQRAEDRLVEARRAKAQADAAKDEAITSVEARNALLNVVCELLGAPLTAVVNIPAGTLEWQNTPAESPAV